MIWWLWTAFEDWEPEFVHIIDLAEWWDVPEEWIDIAWLGETAWVGTTDNMGMGLRTV